MPGAAQLPLGMAAQSIAAAAAGCRYIVFLDRRILFLSRDALALQRKDPIKAAI